MTQGLGAAAPAGFWRRALAYGLDWLLLAPILIWFLAPTLGAALTAMLDLNSLLQDWLLEKMLAGAQAGAVPSPLNLARALEQDAPLLASVNAAFAIVLSTLTRATLLAASTAAIYFIGFEASAWQATPGKRWLGIRVVDRLGQRIGWPRACARFLAGSLSWLSLNLGHALAAWRSDGRALHDLVAGTRVVLTPRSGARAPR